MSLTKAQREILDRKVPTIQIFDTVGAATYVVPSPAPLYIKVRMVGGGAGGANSGTSSTTFPNSTAGGNTTFDSFVTAPGGKSSNERSPASPTDPVTISTPAVLIHAITGAIGQGGGNRGSISSSAIQSQGGNGASNPLGTGGGGGAGITLNGLVGSNAVGYGAGGGGGGCPNASTGVSGAGGSSGTYVEFIIPNPTSSYSLTIGAGGAGATGSGGNFANGGNGSKGAIIIEEYYL